MKNLVQLTATILVTNVFLNAVLAIDDARPLFNGMNLAATHGEKVPGLTRNHGLIGLQNHGDPVSFRNIRY